MSRPRAAGRRRIDAVLLLDKPPGLSSNAALQTAKRLFGAAKAGHGGTLDPLATGVLPILFGEATKFAHFLLQADKEYLASIKLGETTDTADAEGKILERRPVAVDAHALEQVLGRFRGELQQVPPMHSALKRDGKPLYVLARQGRQVERQPRRVQIHELTLLQRRGELLELRVRCSKGTYVRTLAEDIGTALGPGAHLAALRRTASGRFGIERSVTLDALAGMDATARDACLLPLEDLLQDLPRVELPTQAADRFRNGQPVAVKGVLAGVLAVFRVSGGLIGMGEAGADGMLRPLRLTAASPATTQAAE